MRYASGVTLIEIMVSLFILSLILLALDAMQLMTLSETRNNLYYAIAVNQMTSFAERLSVLKDTDNQSDFERWQEQNKQILPNGRSYLHGQYPNYDVTIFWGDSRSNDCPNQQVGKVGCLHELIYF